MSATGTPVISGGIKTPAGPKAKTLRVDPESLKFELNKDCTMDDPFVGVRLIRKRKTNVVDCETLPFHSNQKSKRMRRKSNAAALKADTNTRRYLPSIDVKQDKGLPRFADETAKLALVNPEFLVNGLQEHSLVRCPKCSGEVELTYKTSYHGLVLHVRCTKYIEAQVDVCETTKEKAEAGRLDVEAVQRAMAVGSEYFGVCDYNEVLVTSKQLQTCKDEVKAVLFGESDNAPNVNCLLEADFFLPIACSLGFLDYTQYRLISESFLFRQQPVHRNIFYKISAEIFDTVRGEQRFGKHTQIVKKIVRGIDEFRAVEKNLSMDTTFSQRRDANFSFTCLMGRELGFVYSAKVLSKVETELKAVQLEGEASRLLVDQALQEKRDGKGPDWRGICTDGHIENAAMFVELLGKYLDEKAVDARVVGLSDCGEENCGCFSKGSREAICGKHAQERDLLLVSYRVQVGSEIFLVNEKQIVSFPGESIDTGADACRTGSKRPRRAPP